MIEIERKGALNCQSCKSSHDVKVIWIGTDKINSTGFRLCFNCRKQLSKMLVKGK